MKSSGISRRRALQLGAGWVAVPWFVPARLLGEEAPSKKITLGLIGIGWMGESNMNGFLRESDCRILACCDLDEEHLKQALRRVNDHYQNQDCRGYKDFRELLAREDIDAVCISTPDHWHSIPAIAAAKAKKDIYAEKPLSHTLAEGRAMVEAVQANGRIWQTGSWQRSVPDFRRATLLVLNGYIGKVQRVEVGLPSGHTDFAGTGKDCPNSDPPPHVDYDLWVGPAPMIPFNRCRFHKNWRWHYNFGGGQLMDWIGHHGDIGHWGLSNPKYGCGPDDKIGPLELSATADFPPKDALWNTATKFRIECRYPNDIEVILAGGHPDIRSGTKWIGTLGWVWVDRGGWECSNNEWKNEIRQREKKGDLEVTLYDSPGHYREFLDSIQSRKRTLTPVEVAHRSQTPGHLGYIASVLGRKIRWDAAKEQILDDPEAAQWLSKTMRAPWHL